MPLVFSRARRRFEYVVTQPDGTETIAFVLPLEGADTSDVDPSRVGKPTASMAQRAAQLLAGDAAAADALDTELDAFNGQVTQVSQAATGQTPARGQQGAMLPSPEYLSAYVDVLSNAAGLADATEKLSQREQTLVREARRLGIPVDPATLYGSGQGAGGPFPTDAGAISEIAATNPAYLRVLGGMNNLAGAIEVNRRQNVLARLQDQIEQRGKEVDLNTRVSAIQRQMRDVEAEAQQAEQDAIRGASPSDFNNRMNRIRQDKDRALARLQADLDDAIEAERPGWKAWQEEGKRVQAFMQRPEVANADNATRDALVQGFVGGTIPNPDEQAARTQAAQGLGIGLSAGREMPAPTPAFTAPPPAPSFLPQTEAERQQEERRRQQEERRRQQEADLGTLPRFAEGGFVGEGFGAAPVLQPNPGTFPQNVQGGDIAFASGPSQLDLAKQTFDQEITAQMNDIRAQQAAIRQEWATVRQQRQEQEQALRTAHEQRMSQLRGRAAAAQADNPFIGRFLTPPAA